MKRDYENTETINGTYGELWIDDEFIASLQSCKATYELTYADVKRPRNLGIGKKLIECNGTGEIVCDKVNSSQVRRLSDKIKAGKTPVSTIVTKLDDPDARGAERAALNNVTFNDLELVNFEHAALVQETLSFNFENYDLYDLMEE